MLNRSVFVSLLFYSSFLSAGPTLHYAGGPENTYWNTSGSVFGCRFEQVIPGYGRAIFYQQAGEPVLFQLEADRNLMDNSSAAVSITAAPWQPATRSEGLGTAKVSSRTPNLELDARRSNQFMHALIEGRWPTISHETWYDAGRAVQIRVSAVQFQEYYPDYLACISQLLPVNYDQVGRSKVLFASGEESLDLGDTDVLDRVIFYINHDPRIFAVYLDGHSDNVGRRYDNRQTSKKRVEAVERYLILKGIDPEMITTRYHGGRYPVADNATASGRAENRRVTIRLEMREDMPIPDDLKFILPPEPLPSANPTAARR